MSTPERFLAWVVTGPLGRGMAFALDFGAALTRALLRRRPGVHDR